MSGKTITEKIFSAHCGKEVRPGDVAICNIDFCFGQDGTSALIIDAFKRIGAKRVFDRDKFCMVLDHSAPSPNIGISEIHKGMRHFAKENGLNLFEVGCGVCHQVIPEAGFITPGDLVIGADSHTCTYGALGAFATGVGSTDLAVTLASGKNWFRVPETVEIVLKGKPRKGVYSKDVILYIIGDLGAAYCTYKAIEFSGDYIRGLTMDARFTIANMAVEIGAKAGIIEPDETTLRYMRSVVRLSRAKSRYRPSPSGRFRCASLSSVNREKILNLKTDGNAAYSEVIEYDVSKIKPQVARPHTVDNVASIDRVKGIKIDEVFLGTCTNGRLEDLKIAASILRNQRVHKYVKMLIAPASRAVFLEAMEKGIISEFIKAGASVISPGCGPCVGTHSGVPSKGENVISTANRNFKGRMGNPEAYIYLASPATVAASAIEGKITDPRKYVD